MRALAQKAQKRFPLGASLIFALFYTAAFSLAVAPRLIVSLTGG